MDHRFTPGAEITVYIVREGMNRRVRLGTVRLSERKTFNFSGFSRGARYQFIATETGGSVYRSVSFQVFPGTVAEWRTSNAVVRLGGT